MRHLAMVIGIGLYLQNARDRELAFDIAVLVLFSIAPVRANSFIIVVHFVSALRTMARGCKSE